MTECGEDDRGPAMQETVGSEGAKRRGSDAGTEEMATADGGCSRFVGDDDSSGSVADRVEMSVVPVR
jgi:hypothetical protein